MFEEDFIEDLEQVEEVEVEDPRINEQIEDKLMSQYDNIDKNKLEFVRSETRQGMTKTRVFNIYKLPNTNIWYEEDQNNPDNNAWWKQG